MLFREISICRRLWKSKYFLSSQLSAKNVTKRMTSGNIPPSIPAADGRKPEKPVPVSKNTHIVSDTRRSRSITLIIVLLFAVLAGTGTDRSGVYADLADGQ